MSPKADLANFWKSFQRCIFIFLVLSLAGQLKHWNPSCWSARAPNKIKFCWQLCTNTDFSCRYNFSFWAIKAFMLEWKSTQQDGFLSVTHWEQVVQCIQFEFIFFSSILQVKNLFNPKTIPSCLFFRSYERFMTFKDSSDMYLKICLKLQVNMKPC